jgi:hypothetical protein
MSVKSVIGWTLTISKKKRKKLIEIFNKLNDSVIQEIQVIASVAAAAFSFNDIQAEKSIGLDGK